MMFEKAVTRLFGSTQDYHEDWDTKTIRFTVGNGSTKGHKMTIDPEFLADMEKILGTRAFGLDAQGDSRYSDHGEGAGVKVYVVITGVTKFPDQPG